MKQKLLFLLFSVLITIPSVAQVTSGQINNFEDGTLQNWSIGVTATNQPTNITTGGPNGVGDNYFNYVTNGNPNGAGSKLIIFNKNSSWGGNYTGASVFGIKFNVRAVGSDLNLRVALGNSLNGQRVCTINSVIVTAGSGWQSVVIPISDTDLQIVGGSPFSITDFLSNGGINEIRILSNTSPSWFGEAFSGVPTTLNIDNIETSTFLSTKDNKLSNAFTISPNPGSSSLNLGLSKADNTAIIEVFDVLGKKIYTDKVQELNKSIDVSKWNSGVYLVRLKSSFGIQTKRFVKH